ncbi:nicotinamide-nucleotide adenylyltransferase [Nonomuraea roseoviolacea subsp. roseoviolacea]|uniref:Nicotinamide-nucleotide adenylyltransferase/phosphinothricin biosynthesis protein PhpF n=1 Tax=Nonomuraea roseoviolacea subsp. carminata TaxID=160689 RepID=A0ABT1K2P4_9ACTN|nr:adenylyltransferase/cytidyltransferase family protein [Nonomuraea roseoviolacea]MCP2348257.1 nicotinamide-nucleotide adenylyltransferase/phosphinothricin biosynthesis protein PhpF [Nonomuraea roseoviolacea subsp. carminata]
MSERTRAPVGVIHGRFQPLHLGHLEYLLAGAERCDVLVVGITNPDPEQTAFEATDPERGSPEANPCTFYDRYLMVEGALREAGVAAERLRIVPFPHGFPERLRHYAPVEATYYLTVYDEWGETKVARFGALGLRTEVMWRRADKPISGSRVRRAIADGGDWRSLVPPAVAAVIEERRLDERIREALSDRAVRGS